jgi:ribosome-associated protein
MMRLDKMTRVAFDALEDVKGRDIQVFNVKSITAIFDTVIVATGDSNRQCRALANRVQEMVKAAGGKIYGVEGEQTGEWLLVDIGATVIHIMQPAIRQYYNLEELWAPAPKAAKVAKAARVVKERKPRKVTKTTKPAKTTKTTKPSAKAPKWRQHPRHARNAPPRRKDIR